MMNPARIIYEDTPAYIPIPEELHHRKVEIIFRPLDSTQPGSITADTAKPRWSELFRRFTRSSDVDPAAIEAGCDTRLTEDMHHGHALPGIHILNPLA